MMWHRDAFVEAIESALRLRCRVKPGDPLLLAVSGGADSVALLRALAVIAERPHWRLRLSVGHVNHHLRAEADEEAAFVATLAGRLGVPFEAADVRPTQAKGNLEAAARRLRYAALEEMAVRVGNAQESASVVTAHHADDQLETMLMRLIRGASVRGMSGMAWRRRLGKTGVLMRPMLRVDHAAAVAFLDRLEQDWREDASNVARSRWRARLRADVLPALRDLRGDAASKAVDTADRFRDAARLVDDQVRQTLEATVTQSGAGMWEMPRESAREMRPALLRSVLRAVLIQAGARPDGLGQRTLEPIIKALRDASGELRRFELSGGVTVRVCAKVVTIASLA